MRRDPEVVDVETAPGSMPSRRRLALLAVVWILLIYHVGIGGLSMFFPSEGRSKWRLSVRRAIFDAVTWRR